MLSGIFLVFVVVFCFIYGMGVSNPSEYSMKMIWNKVRGRKPLPDFSPMKS